MYRTSCCYSCNKAINDEGLFKLNTSEHSPKNSCNIKAPYMGYNFTNSFSFTVRNDTSLMLI